MEDVGGRHVGVAVSADIVLAAVAEGGVVGADDIAVRYVTMGEKYSFVLVDVIHLVGLVVEALLLLAVETDDEKALVDGTVLAAGVVEALVLDIDAGDVAHLIVAAGYLLDELAIHSVEVDVAVAVFFACDEHLLLGFLAFANGDELPSVGHIDVCVALLFVHDVDAVVLLSDIVCDDLHVVLQTVHTHHGQHFRVVGPLETRDVFPLVKQLCVEQDRGIEKAFTFLYIIHFHHHPRVILAGLGVFVFVILRI